MSSSFAWRANEEMHAQSGVELYRAASATEEQACLMEVDSIELPQTSIVFVWRMPTSTGTSSARCAEDD